MARLLIVGGGCRGRLLARELIADGHALRLTTRDEKGRAEIEATGAECWIGTPDRVASLRYALAEATVLLWALGTVRGPAEEVAALHGPRLQMMLSNTIDTTVRGIIYEAAGGAGASALAAGAATVTEAAQRSQIAYRLLRADPEDVTTWMADARGAFDELLSASPGPRGA